MTAILKITYFHIELGWPVVLANSCAAFFAISAIALCVSRWYFKSLGCPIHITAERGLHSYSFANLLAANRSVGWAVLLRGGGGGYSLIRA